MRDNGPADVRFGTRSSLTTLLNGRRLPGLDGLRAVAVGLVVAYHAGAPVPGDLGVSLFFVLSGFLITWLLLREYRDHGAVSLREFYWRRTFRIFPAYYVFLALSWSADTMLSDPWTSDRTFAGLLYLINYHNAFGGHDGPASHAWSLAIEEQFYILWPALFLFAARRGIRGLIAVTATCVVGVFAWRATAYLSGLVTHVYVYNAFDTRFDQLAIGCLLALGASHVRVNRVVSLLSKYAWTPVIVIACLLTSRMWLGEAWHYSAGYTVEGLLLAILIVQTILLSDHPAYRWLSWRPITWLGLMSYSLYLWHGWGLTVGHRFGPGAATEVAAGVAASIALAAASYYLVERPMLQLRDHPRLSGREIAVRIRSADD